MFKNNLHLLLITDDLITKARSARQKYVEFLENEKKKKEENAAAEEKEKRRIELEKENLKNRDNQFKCEGTRN